MRKYLMVSLKGALLGFVSLAIPGLSASTIAIIIGIYYTLINSISNIFKEFKKSIVFLSFLLLGFGIGSILAAVSVDIIYNHYPLVIIVAAFGFILGGLPNIIKNIKEGFKKVSCWIVFIVIVFILSFYSYYVTKGQVVDFVDMQLIDYIVLFIVGVITASTLVIPGVDFAILLISLGYYHSLVSVIANIFDFGNFVHSITILGVYIAGYLIGSLLFSKLIKLLTKRYYMQMQFANFAFVIASIPVIIKKCMIDNANFVFTVPQLIVGILAGIIGFLIMVLIPRTTDNGREIVYDQA